MSENAEQEQMLDALMRERRRKGMKRQKTLLCVLMSGGRPSFQCERIEKKEEKREREKKVKDE